MFNAYIFDNLGRSSAKHLSMSLKLSIYLRPI